MTPATTSIEPVREVRTCREHLCRILRQKRFWIQCFCGELGLRVTRSSRVSREADHKGRVAVWHVNIYLHKIGSLIDHDYEVLQAYCGMTDDGIITGSGLMDPKNIIIDGINYCQLSRSKPSCDLCENGDMIPLEERFMNAKYIPETPPFSLLRKLGCKARKKAYRYWDLTEQRLVLMKYRAKIEP
jgi:hypothetical protein